MGGAGFIHADASLKEKSFGAQSGNVFFLEGATEPVVVSGDECLIMHRVLMELGPGAPDNVRWDRELGERFTSLLNYNRGWSACDSIIPVWDNTLAGYSTPGGRGIVRYHKDPGIDMGKNRDRKARFWRYITDPGIDDLRDYSKQIDLIRNEYNGSFLYDEDRGLGGHLVKAMNGFASFGPFVGWFDTYRLMTGFVLEKPLPGQSVPARHFEPFWWRQMDSHSIPSATITQDELGQFLTDRLNEFQSMSLKSRFSFFDWAWRDIFILPHLGGIALFEDDGRRWPPGSREARVVLSLISEREFDFEEERKIIESELNTPRGLPGPHERINPLGISFSYARGPLRSQGDPSCRSVTSLTFEKLQPGQSPHVNPRWDVIYVMLDAERPQLDEHGNMLRFTAIDRAIFEAGESWKRANPGRAMVAMEHFYQERMISRSFRSDFAAIYILSEEKQSQHSDRSIILPEDVQGSRLSMNIGRHPQPGNAVEKAILADLEHRLADCPSKPTLLEAKRRLGITEMEIPETRESYITVVRNRVNEQHSLINQVNALSDPPPLDGGIRYFAALHNCEAVLLDDASTFPTIADKTREEQEAKADAADDQQQKVDKNR